MFVAPGSSASTTIPGLASSNPAAEFVPGEVLVQFAGTPTMTQLQITVVDVEALQAKPLTRPGLYLMKLASGTTVEEALATLSRRRDIRYAEPNYIYTAAATPNDTRFAELWGLHQPNDADIDAPEAWNLHTGATSGIVVGVVDTGVAYGHPDIAPNMWPGIGSDFVQNDSTPYDYNGHGTHVAGTIGGQGNNGLGVAGVNWDVQLMALRAGDASGSFDESDIVDAFTYACTNGARIVNGSFGGRGVAQAIYDAIVAPACANTLFVFAAGNSNVNNDVIPHYPCNYHRPGAYGAGAANVICVAATDPFDNRADFSNYGAQSVHLAAPGEDILSTWPAYQTVWGPDGFDDLTDAGFNARWGDRTSTVGDELWGRTTTVKDSGSHSLTDSPSGDYVDDSLTTIRRLAPFSLTGQAGCRAFYDLRLATEFEADPFLIFTGATTATTTDAGGWWGSTGGAFLRLDTDLSMMDGQGTVYIRLGLESDFSVVDDGAYVDDLLVGCLNHAGAAYETISGTSMASPHVAGVAALALAQTPALSTAQLKARVLSAVDPLPGLAGVVSTGGRLNACRALTGCVPTSPAPPPPAEPPPPLPPTLPPSPLPPTPPPVQPPPVVRPPTAVRCVVPNVKGKTLPKARAALKAKRCALGKVTRAYSSKVKKGRVIAQSRRPGARLPRNSKVALKLSKGARKK